MVIDGVKVAAVRANPRVPAWTLLRFTEAAAGGVDAEDVEGQLMMLRMVRRMVHPGDLVKLEATLDEHEPTPAELLEVVASLMRGATGRPTVRPSGSSGGPPRTGGTSAAGSSSPATTPPGREAEWADLDLVPVTEMAAHRSA